MEIHVNGNRVFLENLNPSIVSLLQQQKLASYKGIAVAVNEEIIPRSKWETVSIQSGDQILIITATQGG